jgi:hypothetical protein
MRKRTDFALDDAVFAHRAIEGGVTKERLPRSPRANSLIHAFGHDNYLAQLIRAINSPG